MKIREAVQVLKEKILNSDNDLDKNGLWDSYLQLIRVLKENKAWEIKKGGE